MSLRIGNRCLFQYSFFLTFHSLCCPVLPWCFQQPCLLPIWDEETVVVGEATLILHARSTLTIFLQQLGNNIHSFFSCVSSLKPKPVKSESRVHVLQVSVSHDFILNRQNPTEQKITWNHLTLELWIDLHLKMSILCQVTGWEIQGTRFRGDLPDKIHAKKSLITISTLSAPHCLISNTHLMLVCAHLCPPQPSWFAQHYSVSVGNLLNLYVCTLFQKTRHRGKCCEWLMACLPTSSHNVGNWRLEG